MAFYNSHTYSDVKARAIGKEVNFGYNNKLRHAQESVAVSLNLVIRVSYFILTSYVSLELKGKIFLFLSVQ